MADWIPKLNPSVDLRKLALSAEEGFVLSRLDGATPARNLPALTGLPVERLRTILTRLISEGALLPAVAASPGAPAPAPGAQAARPPVAAAPPARPPVATTAAHSGGQGVFPGAALGVRAAPSADPAQGTNPVHTGSQQAASPLHTRPTGAQQAASPLHTGPTGAQQAASPPHGHTPPARGASHSQSGAVGEPEEDLPTLDLTAHEAEASQDAAASQDAEASQDAVASRDAGDTPDAAAPRDPGDPQDDAEPAEDEPEVALGNYRQLFETRLHPLPEDQRVAHAHAAEDPVLSALCFDPVPAVIKAVLENARTGLAHARLVARYHRNPVGLEALCGRAAFTADLGVRRWLVRNPQLPAGLFRRLWGARRLMELHKVTNDRDVPEGTRRSAREVLRQRFVSGPAEEKVELIINTEGRSLAALIGLPVDGKTSSLLCGRTYRSPMLIQNIARWSAAPPALIAHLLRQEAVRRQPQLRILLTRHPNAPADAKRGA